MKVKPPVRILFLGMNGAFSHPIFEALLAAQQHLVGVGIPHSRPISKPLEQLPFSAPPKPAALLPLTGPQSNLVQLAAQHSIPLFEFGFMRHPSALSLLEKIHPDLIVVACFPKLLPPEWFTIPRLGALNLHPSLLPAYRGPTPLFWQLRAGEQNTGTTLHFIDAGMDTGDIAAQQSCVLPDGITGPQADQLLGQTGAELLAALLRSSTAIPRQPQPTTGVSYQSFPTEADRIIPTTWSARRAYNFICGCRAAWGPFTIQLANHQTEFIVSEALQYDPGQILKNAYHKNNGQLQIQFNPGVLVAR